LEIAQALQKEKGKRKKKKTEQTTENSQNQSSISGAELLCTVDEQESRVFEKSFVLKTSER
jgi:hypothetical protein